jgi:hypothetical protein
MSFRSCARLRLAPAEARVGQPTPPLTVGVLRGGSDLMLMTV